MAHRINVRKLAITLVAVLMMFTIASASINKEAEGVGPKAGPEVNAMFFTYPIATGANIVVVQGFGWTPEKPIIVSYTHGTKIATTNSVGQFKLQIRFTERSDTREEKVHAYQNGVSRTDEVEIVGTQEGPNAVGENPDIYLGNYATLEGTGWKGIGNTDFRSPGTLELTIKSTQTGTIRKETISLNQWGGFFHVWKVPFNGQAPDTYEVTVGANDVFITTKTYVKEAMFLNRQWEKANLMHGTAGDTLKLSAIRLQPYANIQVLVDGNLIEANLSYQTTDRDGSINVEITVPAKLGIHQITLQTSEQGGFAEAKAFLIIHPE